MLTRCTGWTRTATRRFVAFLLLAGVAVVALPSAVQGQESTIIRIGRSSIEVEYGSGDWGSVKPLLPEWIKSAGDSVATYYGRFPLTEVQLNILPFDGEGVRHGTTYGEDGGYIVIHVGNKTTRQDFASDWMLTHEMVHLAFPSVAHQHHWIEEGIATYVEPIARVEAGHMDVKEMWFELVRDLPQGLPGPGDEGLDNTYTWANTYWGGARYCFLADIAIRRETRNRKGLQDALRGILDAGGDIRQSWDLERALQAGDKAVGVNVLMNLYEKMKDLPASTDLPQLWAELGIERVGDSVVFNNEAALAVVREAIAPSEQIATGN